MSRSCVNDSGYQYRKKKSRSKHFGNSQTTESSRPKRPKLDKFLRATRSNEIKEELNTLNSRIDIKEKLLQQKVNERKFDVCDSIAGEIEKLKCRRRELEREFLTLEKKEKRLSGTARKSNNLQYLGLLIVMLILLKQVKPAH